MRRTDVSNRVDSGHGWQCLADDWFTARAKVMAKKLTLGYRLVESAAEGPLLLAGERMRGHEFHYSIWENRPPDL